MSTPINHTSVEKAKPPASGYIILFDDKLDGFGLRVTGAGSKSFVLNYRDANGDKRRCTIGKYSKWTADAARDEAANVLLPAINKKGAGPVSTHRFWQNKTFLIPLPQSENGQPSPQADILPSLSNAECSHIPCSLNDLPLPTRGLQIALRIRNIFIRIRHKIEA